MCTDDSLRHPELCDFTLASKKACHCEDERSEDVAIAKSLNINEITTSHFVNAPRNDTNREGTCDFSLAPLGRGIEGEGLTKTDRAITPRGPILHEINRFRQKEASAR